MYNEDLMFEINVYRNKRKTNLNNRQLMLFSINQKQSRIFWIFSHLKEKTKVRSKNTLFSLSLEILTTDRAI